MLKKNNLNIYFNLLDKKLKLKFLSIGFLIFINSILEFISIGSIVPIIQSLITPDTIDKSMKRHMKTSIEMYNGVTIDKQVRQSIEQMRDEWNQGWQL